MSTTAGSYSPSGVWRATDFRDNLIIDRYDPIFSTMRASKYKHLHSENSEDAITWNVFRSLRQVDSAVWLRELAVRAFGAGLSLPTPPSTVSLWVNAPPPPGLLAEGDEGISEIDVVVEAPMWVWFIEAKYRSDISEGTTTRPDRDQILRNLDVGSYYAGVREFYFSLLIRDGNSPKGEKLVNEYRDLAVPRARLKAHRVDGLQNLRGVSLLRWSDLADVLQVAAEGAAREDERAYAGRAREWIRKKGIG